MNRVTSIFAVVAAFALGIAAASFAEKETPKEKPKAHDPSALYAGKDSKAAGQALLSLAESQAGDGSWELIGVGRIYYLSGDKTKGQALFDRVTANKPKSDDWERIARVYNEAGDWDKAELLFKKFLSLEPDDDSEMAYVGALYNLKGDRARAEELFAKAFKANPKEVWNTLNAAGSYLGVKPQ